MRHFSIPTMFRMTPPALLEKIFAKLGHQHLNVRWRELHRHGIEPVLEAFRNLAADKRAAVESVLQSIFELACENGVSAILEAADDARQRRSMLYLPDVGGPYCVATWAWLHYPEVFDRATLLHQVDSLSRWRKRKNLPRLAPLVTPKTLESLAGGLSALLYAEQGRGQRCTVEHVYRSDGGDYFFAYPDDFVKTVTVHEEGRLVPRSIRQTFEMVFVYDRDEGTLETFAHVPTKLKPRLEEAFCRTVLGREPEPAERQAIYNLNILKDAMFQLPTDAEDGVAARICRLRLAVPNTFWSITLESGRNGPADEMAEMVDECLNEENLPLCRVSVTSARFRFEFYPRDDRKRGSLTFDVGLPDSCSLRNQRPDRVAMAQKYLKRWRIAVG